MQTFKIPNVDELIPHRQTMKLLDEILEIDNVHVKAKTKVLASWPNCINGQVSSIIFVELVAQGAAAVAGWLESPRGDPRPGLLVGIKKAEFYSHEIRVGLNLLIEVEMLHTAQNYGVFHGTVLDNQESLAIVEVQVYLPEDINILQT